MFIKCIIFISKDALINTYVYIYESQFILRNVIKDKTVFVCYLLRLQA